MTRTEAREIAIQIGFAVAMSGDDPREAAETFLEEEHYRDMQSEEGPYASDVTRRDRAYILDCVEGVAEHRAELDEYIARYARGWRTERISKTAQAVLRQCMYEILYREDVPAPSAIDEAVELCKHYDGPDIVSFVNGVLSGFIQGENPPEKGGAV